MTDQKRSLSVEIVSTVGYLLGVQREIFEREYKTTVFEDLEIKPDAKVMRCLCMIRNSIVKNLGMFESRMRYDLEFNLDRIPEYLEPEVIPYLASQSIFIVKTNPKPILYLSEVNRLINERIQRCSRFFPSYVQWEYIRKVFQMPRWSNERAVRETVTKYHLHDGSYPYGCYINWPVDDPRAYAIDPEANGNLTTGNVLQNDLRFLQLLYYVNNDEFDGYRFVTDVGREVRQDLGDFLTECRQIVLAVDCENSDPYKLCAVLAGLKESSLRSGDRDSFRKLKKIILYDDVHTIDAWEILKDYVSVPIEHIETERVNDRKSLVDVQLTAGVSREHYRNGIDGILLASSDSDFWGLICSLPTANFMVLLEKEKYGQYLTETFAKNRIRYCFMDDFAGNMDEIKLGALDRSVREYIADRIRINLKEAVSGMYDDLRIDMTDKQKKNYYASLLKRLDISVNAEGELSIEVKEKA